MFESLINGFKLGSATRKLVFKDKRLLLYPVVMGIIGIIEFIVIFVGSLILTGGLAALGQGIGLGIIAAVILFYLVSAFTTTYITIAMLLAFRSFVKGKEMSMGEALSAARPYLTLAFEWALFYSIVAIILNAIESRFRGIANILISAVGSLALTVAIMFAIPAIIDNKVGPIGAVEASVKTITKHFGATFGGIAYTDLYSLAVMLFGFLILLVGLFSGALPFLAVPIAALGVIIIAFGAILGFSLSNIFRFVLYEYVNGKPLPEGFDAKLVDASTKRKRQDNTAVL